ncbi:hypothetical protein JQ596_12220 [Bradyrhizobium manausense]|uniref:hypothetical protein n=1 Tax=Bradyrhizobium TaxID=374 RepID=UPI001BA91AA2|nr:MULTISPECIES: hypothetical protein [Bradyrhizobium]MBR0826306.1 hypothetical protein [Bradyrhizobium manausense]UVO31688.1 hypothetical protein KUF59_14215 [Bradyrhizobium arachidis]
MNDDVDYDLSPDQWEALKALRHHLSRNRHVKAYMVEDLAKLGLVAISEGLPLLTPTGRKVLVRGSCRLLDLAA